MARKSLDHFNCSWAQASQAIGDKWSVMIIRDAFYGVKTFTSFQKNIGISKNILTQRLEHLQEYGILEKKSIGLGSSRSEYCLTEKGLDLFSVVVALGQWADRWVFKDKEPITIVDLKNRKPIKKLVVKSSENEDLSLRDITFVAGPGACESTIEIADEINDIVRQRGL